MKKNDSVCGYVSIIGKTNVGKSTLINTLIDKKISITSSKPQTTLVQLYGIATNNNTQIIYIDTVGILLKRKSLKSIPLNYRIDPSVHDSNIIVFVIDSGSWGEEDELILKEIQKINKPLLIAISKIDKLKNKNSLLPIIGFLKTKIYAKEIIPISAINKTNISLLKKKILPFIPKSVHKFKKHESTDKNRSFLTTEIIREKIFRLTGEELPYVCNVKIEQIKKNKNGSVTIHCAIEVSKTGQRKILLGRNGIKIKEISIKSRLDLEKLYKCKINLVLWVKIPSNKS